MFEAGEPVTQTYLDAGSWDVEIAGKKYPAVASMKPLYDPENKRSRGRALPAGAVGRR
jgi:4-methylaminobutanoate oxidase (formaldehyde-forming)